MLLRGGAASARRREPMRAGLALGVGHQAQHDVADGTFELLQRVGSLKQALLVGIFMRTPLRCVLTGPDRTAERARFPVYPAAARVPEAMAVATAEAMAR